MDILDMLQHNPSHINIQVAQSSGGKQLYVNKTKLQHLVYPPYFIYFCCPKLLILNSQINGQRRRF